MLAVVVNDILERTKLFGALPSDGLRSLAERGKRRTFSKGDVLMRQGDPSPSLHVILSGRLRVERGETGREVVVLAELGSGEVVGEMGLLDNEPRSATVTAIEDTATLEVHADALAIIILDHPVVSGKLLRMMSRRLRNIDELVDQISRERGPGPSR